MDYQMLVKNLFNDLFVFFNGREPLGFEPLQDAYQEEPLFLALIGGLDEAIKVSYNDAMKESYAFYKKYCGRELSEADWDQVVDEIKKFNEKWGNAWCKRVILAILSEPIFWNAVMISGLASQSCSPIRRCNAALST